MYNRLRTKISNIIPNKKNILSPQKNNKILELFNQKTQTPLFKILMDNTKIKKIHLMKNSVTISKEEKNHKNKKGNIFQNPQLISFKILEAKYNMTPKLYSQKIIFNLVGNKRGRLLSTYHEIILYDNSLKEYMKRPYKLKECIDKIPKYYNYYKNYLRFFCHPTFVDYFINKRMVKHMEKIAQIFYNRNYLEENKNDKNICSNIIIFNKRVIKDIERISQDHNNNVTKDNQIKANNNNDQNNSNLEITPISSIIEGQNFPFSLKNSDFIKSINSGKEESFKTIFLNSNEQNIIESNFGSIPNKIETNDSLNTLINEIKENNNNKSSNTKIEQEEIKKYIKSEDISSLDNNIEIIPSTNANNKSTKKMSGFKYNTDKIYLNHKISNKKVSNIEQNKHMKVENLFVENDKEKPSLLNKKTINNLNININQLIINNKIITNFQENSRNKEYNKLFYKNKENNNQILNEIKEILKEDTKMNINKEVKNNQENNNQILNEIKEILKEEKKINFNNEIMNNNKKIKTKFNKNIKNIKDFKATINALSSQTNKIFPSLNRVNSMEKLTPFSLNRKEIKQRNISNLRNQKGKRNISLLKLGGNILENQGKITLLMKNSNNNNQNLMKNFNFTKINTKRGKTGTSNDITIHSNNTNKNYYIINSDRNIDKRRTISNSKNSQKRIFKSGIFNLTNEKLNSGANSPNNSIQNKNNQINNLKFNLHLKDLNYINNKEVPFIVRKKISHKIFGRKKGNEKKLKLKNFDCIGIERIHKEIFSPRKSNFSNSPLSVKSN